MKKVLMFFAATVAVLGLMACTSTNETTTEANATTEENVETEAAVEPQQRDFESVDLSVTIPEGWTGKIGAFDEVKMEGKSDDGFNPKIEVDVVKGRKASELADQEKGDDIVKNEGVKIGEYTFTTMNNEGAGSYKCFAQVGENVLRVWCVFIKPDAPEVKGVVESIKLK